VIATKNLDPGFDNPKLWGPDVPDYSFKTKSEFSRSHSEIADIEILKQNIVNCIEFLKIP
jgi:hypothetical protein